MESQILFYHLIHSGSSALRWLLSLTTDAKVWPIHYAVTLNTFPFHTFFSSSRVAHAIGLDYQGIEDKFNRGELERKIASDGFGWRDEDPNAVF